MAEILERLHEDHLRMMQLVRLVERELALLEGDEPADLALMHDALHYLVNYAFLYHHPIEDRLFERLVRANDFLAVQRAHRGFEEAVVFPFARRTLVEDDWREVADAARQVTASQADPLFGTLVRQEYERLKSAL